MYKKKQNKQDNDKIEKVKEKNNLLNKDLSHREKQWIL